MDFLLLGIHHYYTESDVDFIIDEELRLLIPPLSKEEYKQLEENICQWGCLDPLKVWLVPDSDEVILLDGHNRYSICCDHNISYVTESVPLIDRAAAIDWMIANQLGRRNLSAKQVSYLRGKQYQYEKQRLANPEGVGGKLGKIVIPQNEGQQFDHTAVRIGKQYGASKATIKRDADYAEAINAILAVAASEVLRQLLSDGSKFTKLATMKLAELVQEEPEVLVEIMGEVQQAPNKTAASAVVQRFISEIKEIPMKGQTPWLIDFDNASDAIDWLQGKFKLADLAKSVADKIAEEESEDWDDAELDED
jgi:hypothetical protein